VTLKKIPIRIIADHREKNSGVIEALEGIEEVNVSIETLTLGDYQVDNRLLFERKKLLDFANSIKDGRLFRQACNLLSSPLKPVIILEGASSDLVSSKMRREAIQGAMINLTIILGLPVLRSLNPEESACLMLYAARQVKTIAGGAIARPGKRPKGKRKTQLHILQGLPGVGAQRAQHLLEVFGSVEAVLTASIQDLAAVDGVGKKTALAIRWAVSEKVALYSSSVTL
jgi:ERCC4-type nuclease